MLDPALLFPVVVTFVTLHSCLQQSYNRFLSECYRYQTKVPFRKTALPLKH